MVASSFLIDRKARLQKERCHPRYAIYVSSQEASVYKLFHLYKELRFQSGIDLSLKTILVTFPSRYVSNDLEVP